MSKKKEINIENVYKVNKILKGKDGRDGAQGVPGKDGQAGKKGRAGEDYPKDVIKEVYNNSKHRHDDDIHFNNAEQKEQVLKHIKHIITPITYYGGGSGGGGTSEHNLLNNIQGGAPDNYWHLNAGQHAEVTGFFAATDITGAEAEVLTLGPASNADALHTHAGLGGGGDEGTDIHNELEGLQGGSSDDPSLSEYYHLTEDQYIALTTVNPSAATGDDLHLHSHSNLFDLDSDDHLQYAHLDGRRDFTGSFAVRTIQPFVELDNTGAAGSYPWFQLSHNGNPRAVLYWDEPNNRTVLYSLGSAANGDLYLQTPAGLMFRIDGTAGDIHIRQNADIIMEGLSPGSFYAPSSGLFTAWGCAGRDVIFGNYLLLNCAAFSASAQRVLTFNVNDADRTLSIEANSTINQDTTTDSATVQFADLLLTAPANIYLLEHNEWNNIQGGRPDEYYHLDEDQYYSLIGGPSVNADEYHTHSGLGEGSGTGIEIHNDLNALQGGREDEYYHLTEDQFYTLIGGPSVGADEYHTHSVEHNDTGGLQGGAADDYYHFTNTQHTEINNFFNNTDITGAEAETLTDGSNADALHTHLGMIGIHNNLSGLQGGTSDNPSLSKEYYHLTADEYYQLVGGPSAYADDLHSHILNTEGSRPNPIAKKHYAVLPLYKGTADFDDVGLVATHLQYGRATFHIREYIDQNKDIKVHFIFSTDKADATFNIKLYVLAISAINSDNESPSWNIENGTASTIDSTNANVYTTYTYTLSNSDFDQGDMISFAITNEENGQTLYFHSCMIEYYVKETDTKRWNFID